jgi:hypothetical protein
LSALSWLDRSSSCLALSSLARLALTLSIFSLTARRQLSKDSRLPSSRSN